MKIQPRNEYVVVSVKKIVRNAGIIVPGQETEENIMVVEAVGPGGFASNGVRAPIEVRLGEPLQVGAEVFIRGGEYDQFKDGEKVCMIVPQSSIIGVVVYGPGLGIQ